jgi:hypothetical protein
MLKVSMLNDFRLVAIEDYPAFCSHTKDTVAFINVSTVNDNLFDNVLMKYQIFNKDQVWLGDGYIALDTLEKYQTWDWTPEGAYAIVAKELNIKLKE